MTVTLWTIWKCRKEMCHFVDNLALTINDQIAVAHTLKRPIDRATALTQIKFNWRTKLCWRGNNLLPYGRLFPSPALANAIAKAKILPQTTTPPPEETTPEGEEDTPPLEQEEVITPTTP